jgi:hypothetical protein
MLCNEYVDHEDAMRMRNGVESSSCNAMAVMR